MSNEKIVSYSAIETQQAAAKFAEQILQEKPSESAVILCLTGDLGAGKTTFVQGFAKGLGIKEKVLSPTFVIMRKFQIPKPTHYKHFYHFDCYRLKDEKDLEILGFQEIISHSENIVTIEWPERIKKILPKKIISITFNHDKENQRTLTMGC